MAVGQGILLFCGYHGLLQEFPFELSSLLTLASLYFTSKDRDSCVLCNKKGAVELSDSGRLWFHHYLGHNRIIYSKYIP